MVEDIKDIKDIKVPIKLRIKAWWNGYDLEDVKARLRELRDHETSLSTLKASPKGTEPDVSSLPWDKIRMEMTQLIWGEGYCGPGGKDHIISMCKLLTMNSEMSALIIGAGLGGPARVLAEEFGVWITAYELSEELATQGMKISNDKGFGSKAIIRPFDPTQENPFDRHYDRAFSKEALYCYPDKVKIIKDVFDTLKHGALFLITDYTLTDISSLENKDVQKWLKQEPSPPYPVTTDNMKTTLEKAGFILRVNEDVSKEYVELIEHSWAKAATVAEHLAAKGEEGTKAIKSLMKEAEFWALRAKLLKEGHIHVWRFLANKPNEKIR
ncbi:MAG: class I SAM-dependent methyltransferase [Emcibacter sp.]|nr:class I SAM-dependent methyltransferase [Emcibacter sp.]